MNAFVKTAAMAACALGLALGGAACAGKKAALPYASHDEAIADFDADGDGKVTREEFLKKWRGADANEQFDMLRGDNEHIQRSALADKPLNVWSAVDSSGSTMSEP